MSSTASPIRMARGDVLAVVSFVLALLYPVALIVNDVVIIVRYVSGPFPFPAAALTYTVLGYLAIPVLVVAIVLGHIALASARMWRRLARVGLIAGYVSVAGLVTIALTLSVMASIYAGRP